MYGNFNSFNPNFNPQYSAQMAHNSGLINASRTIFNSSMVVNQQKFIILLLAIGGNGFGFGGGRQAATPFPQALTSLA